MAFDRILVLCIGNICRSPMAQAQLKAALESRQPAVVVDSAGTGALQGHPADPIAVQLMAARGLDISDHRARQLTGAMLTEYPLVLVMEGAQRRQVEERWPHARGRVHDIGRWGDFDVPDPYRGSVGEFEFALTLIDRGIAQWVERLAASGPV